MLVGRTTVAVRVGMMGIALGDDVAVTDGIGVEVSAGRVEVASGGKVGNGAGVRMMARVLVGGGAGLTRRRKEPKRQQAASVMGMALTARRSPRKSLRRHI